MRPRSLTKFSMGVLPEASPALDTVFIDDPQRAKRFVLGVEVLRETESVERIEPTVVGVPSGIPWPFGDLQVRSSIGGRRCRRHCAFRGDIGGLKYSG